MSTPRSLTWLDRLRIERAIWTIDVLTSDLPARRQRAITGELRANLRVAVAVVGAAEAVRQLGSLRRLAAGYVASEYGEDGPRPRVLHGAVWMIAACLFAQALFVTRAAGFVDGILAVNPHATGHFAFQALAPGFPSGDVALVDGAVRGGGLVFFLPALLLPPLFLFAAFVLGARLWRLLPFLRRPRVSVE